jgi:hypothetical protein
MLLPAEERLWVLYRDQQAHLVRQQHQVCPQVA